MPSRSLPVLPHWDHIRKQAKDLLAALRANDPASITRTAVYSATFSPARNAPSLSVMRLSDAQLVVAREYGFASWPRLKQHIAQMQAAHQADTPRPDGLQQPSPSADSETAHETGSVIEAYPDTPQDIRVAAWEETCTMAAPLRSDSDWEPDPTPTSHWIRLNPPAHAWHHDYSDSWSHAVIDARGQLSTGSSWDHSVLYPSDRHYTVDDLLRKVTFPHFQPEEDEKTSAEELQTW